MAHRRQNSKYVRKSGPRGSSLVDLFFPNWWEARDRRRKAVALVFLLVFAAVLLSILVRWLGWDLDGHTPLVWPR